MGGRRRGHELTRLADSRRENMLAACGWQILRVTYRDLRDPAGLVALIEAARTQRTAMLRSA